MSRHALIIGINRYDRLKRLLLPSSDAEAIAGLLAEHGGFRITRLPERIAPDRTGVVIDPDARVNEAHLRQAIIRLFKPDSDQYPDVALLFVAGHGLQQHAGVPISHLAASNTDPNDDRWGVSLKWLGELLQASPVRNQIVWLDTCHSGGLLDFRQADPGRGSRCLIAASRNFEEAYEAIDGRHGVLAGALLQALNPARQPDGRVTNSTLVADVQRLLAAETQHPVCLFSGEPIELTWRAVEIAQPAAPTGRCPYKGLRYFDRDGEDPDDFFGREALTDQLIDRLRSEDFLAVVGVSGSGKSSVVRAGLLHELKLGERIGGSRNWPQIVMVPGSNPLASLHAALVRQTDLAEARAAALLTTPAAETLAEIAAELTGIPLSPGGEGGRGEGVESEAPQAQDRRLVLLVDQFEELFTQADSPARERFLACLLGALDLAVGRLALVITLRADFYAKCAEQEYSGLARRIQDHQVIVQPMSPAELREAIVAPARRVGLTVDEDLIVQLLDEVHDAPGNLPLLQDTLTELWQQAHARGTNGDLTLVDYNAKEGLAGTLKRRADRFYEHALDPDEKAAAQWILVQLTRLGEGTEDTRRRLPQADLVNLRFGPELIERTLAKLASPEARLLVTSSLLPRSGEAEIPTVEVAHEALIRHWPKLGEWLKDAREFQTWLRKLQGEAADWAGHGRDPDLLPRGARLADAEERRRGAEDLLDATTSAFIESGLALRERERREKEEHQQRERRLAEERREERRRAEEAQRVAAERLRAEQAKAREERQETRLFWTRLVAVLGVVGLVIAGGLGLWAMNERGNAVQSEQARTESLFDSRLTHAALLARGEDYAEAREVLRSTIELDDAIPEERRHTRNLLAGFVDIMGGSASKVYTGADVALAGGASVSRDGRWLAAAGEHGTLVLFNAETGQMVKRLEEHDREAGARGAVTSVVFSPTENGTLFSAGEDRRIIRWSVPDGQKRKEWESPGSFYALAISPNGKMLASAGYGKSVNLWSTETGGLIGPLESDTDMIEIYSRNGLAFSPDGRSLAGVSADGIIRFWDVETFELRRKAMWHGGGIEAIAFSPRGDLVATAGVGKSILLWDGFGGPLPIRELKGHLGSVFDVSIIDAGNSLRLFSTSRDKTMRLWDPQSAVTLRTYQGHTAGVWNVARHGNNLYTASDDHTVRRWSLDTPGQWLWDVPGKPISAAVSTAGGFVALGFKDGAVRTYALPESAAESSPVNHPSQGSGAASPTPPMQPIVELADAHHAGGVQHIVINADGKMLASEGNEGAKLWRITRGANGLGVDLVQTLKGYSVDTFSKDGGGLLVIRRSDGKRRIVKAGKGRWGEVTQENFWSHEVPATELDARLKGFADAIDLVKELKRDDVVSVRVRNDGRQVTAVGRGACPVALYELGSKPVKPACLVGHENTVWRARYAPDGGQLATVSEDKTVRFWDLRTDKELFSLRLPQQLDESPSGPGDFDFSCTRAGDCWIAVPLMVGRTALYRLPYLQPPDSLR